MSLASLSIRRRVTVLMVTLGIIVFGWFSLNRLKLTLLPEISYPTLTVRTEIPGTSPEEVETLISKPIEESLGVLNNLKRITSVSMAGMSDVIIELNWNADMDRAIMDVRERLDGLILPDEAEPSRLLRYNPETDPIMKLALTGDSLVELYEIADTEIKPRLETLDGVAAAQIIGGEQEEILIEIDPNQLAAMDLSIHTVAQRLQRENINLPGGVLQEGNKQFLVRTLNEFISVAEIGDIIVNAGDQSPVKLRDIARIQRTIVDKETLTHLGGRESVQIEIYKEGDANIIEVADRVRGQIQPAAPRPGQGRFTRTRTLAGLLPDDARLEIIGDQSVFIRAAISEVKSTAIIGCILAVLVLYLFLRNLTHTSIVALAIPISIIATFTLMFFKHISLNLMSLGGIALGIGMLVDNAIVVIENIFRRKEEGYDSVHAARAGTEDVSTAVSASTLTTIAVFFPIIFVTGIAGQIFNDLAWTVAFSLLASLAAALTLIPMITSLEFNRFSRNVRRIWILRAVDTARAPAGPSSKSSSSTLPGRFLRITLSDLKQMVVSELAFAFRPVRTQRPWMGTLGMVLLFPLRITIGIIAMLTRTTGFLIQHLLFIVLMPLVLLLRGAWWMISLILKPVLMLFDRSFNSGRTLYSGLLKSSFDHAAAILSACVILFVLSIFVIGPRLGMNLIPSMSQGSFYIDIKLPVGTRLETTEKVARSVAAIAGEYSEIQSTSAVVGTSESSSSSFGVKRENLAVVQINLRDHAANRVTEQRIMELLRTRISQIPGIEKLEIRRPTLFTMQTPLEIELRGENLKALLEQSDLLVRILKTQNELADVTSTLEPGYPEIHIAFDRIKLARLNLTPADIADQMKRILEGDVPTEFKERGEEIDIRIRAHNSLDWTVDRLKNVVVDPMASSPVLLGSVARITKEIGPSEIRRINQRRVAIVKSDVRFLDLKQTIHHVEQVLAANPAPTGIYYFITGQSEEMEASSKSLQLALLMAIFLVYLVMASQFESLVHPLIILFSIPLALIGVIWGLWLLQIPLSVVVFIGVIVLTGIVVNNAIVLVDTINQLRRDGEELRAAIHRAGLMRFRPILMTAITTILGLLPMALEQGPGVEIRVPLAITVILGLVVSTVLTLVVIPTAYYSVSRLREKGTVNES